MTFLTAGCGAEGGSRGPEEDDGRGTGGGNTLDPSGYADNLDALFDVLLPAERDADGAVISPGAREVGADALLSLDRFGPLASTQGFVPPLPADLVALFDGFDVALRSAINVDLDVLAGLQQPFVAFRDLSAAAREAAVAQAFDDDLRRPLYLVVRAAAFAAYLGAGRSDAGLREVGYPAFEDYAGGIATSGYPRTVSDGRRIDAESEDLAALAAAGELDDYSYNLAPLPTDAVDLASVLDENGELF
ncbi:MAG: hypothetical protein KC731_05225 [Myxococcales bacterium]|nr:hypothetical protein [Myxococcales bacterium]